MVTVMSRGRRRYGGYIVHVGVISIAVAHAAAIAYQVKEPVTFVKDTPREVLGYEVTYLGSEWDDQPHRKSHKAKLRVVEDGRELGVFEPRLNYYKKMGTPIGTPVVRSGLTEDLYFSLINIDEGAGTASLDVMLHPMVWWLWFGGALMMGGTLVAGWPSRKKSDPAKAAVASAAK